MNIYFAPMEGITGYIYRNAYNKCFRGVDKFFTPFIVAATNRTMSSRELSDILRENNENINLVPQILTNNAKAFIRLSKIISDMGYSEINLNLGCPSKTVVTKGRGSGFLDKTKELDNFFEEVFSKCTFDISVKTRIGKDFPEEFYDLIEIYNKYPIKELIIHPRTQADLYKNNPNMEMFEWGLKNSKNPVCYNGNIFTKEQYEDFSQKYPEVLSVMLGRGLLRDPYLIERIKEVKINGYDKLKEFHDIVLEGYKKVLYGDKAILFKMKELWGYMIDVFGLEEKEKYAKKIKKVQKLSEYEVLIHNIFTIATGW